MQTDASSVPAQEERSEPRKFQKETDGDELRPPEPLSALPHPPFWDKARRAIWFVVWALVYRLVPTPFFIVRCGILRLFGASIAKGALPYPTARIWAPWNLDMRRNSCLASGVECYNVAPVVLMEDCTVSQRASLCTATHDFRDENFTLLASPIVVGPKGWVAAEAFVGPGVVLGEAAVVGARTVVMRSVPRCLVVAGNPARAVSRRHMKPAGPPRVEGAR